MQRDPEHPQDGGRGQVSGCARGLSHVATLTAVNSPGINRMVDRKVDRSIAQAQPEPRCYGNLKRGQLKVSDNWSFERLR